MGNYGYLKYRIWEKRKGCTRLWRHEPHCHPKKVEEEGEGRGKAKRRGQEEQKTIEQTQTKQEPAEKSEVKPGYETQTEAQQIKETDYDLKESVKS